MREEGSLKVTYRLNFIEVYEFSVRGMLWLARKQKSGRAVCLFFGILAFALYLIPYLRVAVITLAVFLLAIPLIRTVKYIRMGVQEEQSISVGGGMIQVQGKECTTFLSSEVNTVTEGWSILMMGRQCAEKHIIYYIISKRAFSSREERESFIACIKEQGSAAELERPEDRRAEAQKEFSFDLDKNQLIRSMTEMDGLIWERRNRSRYRLKSVAVRVLLICCTMIILVIFLPATVSALRMAVIAWMIVIMLGRTPLGTDYYRKAFEQGLARQNLVGHWTVRMNAQGIYAFRPCDNSFVKWDFYQEMIERDSSLYLYRYRNNVYQIIPKSVFKNTEEMADFIRYCREKGLDVTNVEKAIGSDTEWAVEVKQGREPARQGAAAWPPGKKFEFAAAVILMVMVAAIPMGRGMTFRSDDARRQSDRLKSGSVSFDEQLSILESLGIRIPERDQEDYRRWLEEDKEYQDYLEQYPYVDILSYAGYGYYDEETGKRIFLDSVFWFDFEGIDVSRDYLDIMEGLNALGKGEFTLTNVSESGSGIDWESGGGELTVSFTYDGLPYQFVAQINNDWIDGEIIDYFNGVLKQRGNVKRMYQLDDGGQGLILFYNTEEWAQEFYKKTGLKLELHQAEV